MTAAVAEASFFGGHCFRNKIAVSLCTDAAYQTHTHTHIYTHLCLFFMWQSLLPRPCFIIILGNVVDLDLSGLTSIIIIIWYVHITAVHRQTGILSYLGTPNPVFFVFYCTIFLHTQYCTCICCVKSVLHLTTCTLNIWSSIGFLQ